MQSVLSQKIADRKIAYSNPLGGSYEALALSKSWMSADGRYGPCGYRGDLTGYSRSRVDWDRVDWASLQDDCLTRNSFRFRNAANITAHTRLSMVGWKHRLKLTRSTSSVRDSRQSTGRTAIVIRTHSRYDYKQEDLINLRSLIAETALSSGGQYTVFLLVDV